MKPSVKNCKASRSRRVGDAKPPRSIGKVKPQRNVVSLVAQILAAGTHVGHWTKTTGRDALFRNCALGQHKRVRLAALSSRGEREFCGCGYAWDVFWNAKKARYELRNVGANVLSKTYAMCHVTAIVNGVYVTGLMLGCKGGECNNCGGGWKILVHDAVFYPCEIHGTPPQIE
jgi:hypothetical protein